MYLEHTHPFIRQLFFEQWAVHLYFQPWRCETTPPNMSTFSDQIAESHRSI